MVIFNSYASLPEGNSVAYFMGSFPVDRSFARGMGHDGTGL